MKRIAVWGCFGGYGGIERMIFNIYKNIDKTKVQFDFLVPHDYGKIAFEEEILSMGGRIFRILYSERESLLKARKCWKDYFAQNPDVVGIHLHANFRYVFPLKMAYKSKVKIRILHSHSSSNGLGKKSIFGNLRDYCIKRDIKKYPNRYVACGNNAARFMFGDKNYIWVKNGIDTKKFAYNAETRKRIRKKYSVGENDTLLLQVGHLTKVKNPLYSIELMKRLVGKSKNIKMIFVGVGPYKGSIEKKIEEYNLGDSVFLVGEQTDVSSFYQAADLLLLPSFYEGFPVVLVEAQTAGLQCLISDKVTQQVAETELCTFISLNKETEWIEKIIQFKSSKNREIFCEKMYESGFDIKSVVQTVEELYEI